MASLTKEEATLWVKELYKPEKGQSWSYVAQKTGWNKAYANLVGRGIIEPSERKLRELNQHLGRVQRRSERWVTPSQIPRAWNRSRKALGLSHNEVYRKGLDVYQETHGEGCLTA